MGDDKSTLGIILKNRTTSNEHYQLWSNPLPQYLTYEWILPYKIKEQWI